MKKFSFMFFMLAILFVVTATACSDNTAIIDELIPKNITDVELSGFYGGGVVEPRMLDQTEIEELSTWVAKLSLTHRTFKKGEAPNDLNGGTAYVFSFNDDELSFAWVDIGTNKYIHYEDEWYEIRNTSKSPLGLPT